MEIHNKSITVVNSTKLNDLNSTGSYFVANHNDKVYTVKEKPRKKRKKSLPTISMWAKPSVRSNYAYKWYYKTFIDYCPHCHHYNVLLKNPKGVPEREYTCRRCDADYCAVTGKEKYSYSRYYLRRA
jgi:N-acetylmuramoyl-L-alanine amidase